jgi:hypothetical protein
LGAPEIIRNKKEILFYLSTSEEKIVKEYFGAFYRIIKKISKMVLIVNIYYEKILVIISQYSPIYRNHLAGINASSIGAGLNFSISIS